MFSYSAMGFNERKSPFIKLRKLWHIFISFLAELVANKSKITGVKPSDYYDDKYIRL